MIRPGELTRCAGELLLHELLLLAPVDLDAALDVLLLDVLLLRAAGLGLGP